MLFIHIYMNMYTSQGIYKIKNIIERMDPGVYKVGPPTGMPGIQGGQLMQQEVQEEQVPGGQVPGDEELLQQQEMCQREDHTWVLCGLVAGGQVPGDEELLQQQEIQEVQVPGGQVPGDMVGSGNQGPYPDTLQSSSCKKAQKAAQKAASVAATTCRFSSMAPSI